MQIHENKIWKTQINEKGGIIPSLNQRLFYIRRLRSSIGHQALLKISNGLFVSKLRYGLQLLGKVRWLNSDPSNQDMEAIQKCQNKLLRLLNNSLISDKISIKSMLSKFNMLSVNQMNAQVKLNEIWKSVHVPNYPVKTSALRRSDDSVNTRAVSLGVLSEAKVSNSSEKIFINDAIHIWNRAPMSIKLISSALSAKKAIRNFVSSLPV